MQTDKISVIGGYCPDQWEDITDKESSRSLSGWKDIVSGKPFHLYWVTDQIQIIKHRNDEIPFMASDKEWLMYFGNELKIYATNNINSQAYASHTCFVYP